MMKKVYLLLIVVITAINTALAGGGCVIDTSNTRFFSPSPDSIPCIERGVGYTQVIQIHVPSTFDVGPLVGLPFPILITVDSLHIDSLSGLPHGLLYQLNPVNGRFKGGQNGCAYVSGTTNDPTGNYPLKVAGTISVSNIPQGGGFPPDTTFNLSALQNFTTMFSLSVDVINPGDVCRPASGILSYKASLNAMMDVYPNPSNGTITVKLNTGGRVNGEIAVTDIAGRKVFTQPVDVQGLYSTGIDLSAYPKGLYTVQLKTAGGFAAKNISIE